MAESQQANQLVNKFVVSLTDGQILGYVTDINVEVDHDQFYFIFKIKAIENLAKTGEIQSGMFSSEKKVKIRPTDIVNVGPDVIILGNGEVPPLREIEQLHNIASEYNTLVKELEHKERVVAEIKEENSKLLKQIDELTRELKRLQIIKEDFEHLKEQLIKQEGQLEMAREYIKLLEGLRHDIDQIKADVETLLKGYIEDAIRRIVNEELNARGLKKTLL